ncbi:MAG: AraC family transcriptional regulator [Clostridiales bacterium]|jgi:AraC-like DNA-binding protein|nr:AraC family transcriptional regulator [Clostridiales bacterium]
MSKVITEFNINAVDFFRHSADDRPDVSLYRPHFHNSYEIYLFLSGDASFTVETEQYELAPYDLLVIPPAKYHYLNPRAGQTYERCVINFLPADIPPHFVGFLREISGYYRRVSDTDVYPLLRRMEACHKKYGAADFAALLPYMLGELILCLGTAGHERAGGRAVSPVTAQILQYVGEHLHEPLSIKTLAEALFISQSHLSHEFRRHYHISVMQYIRQKKILTAQKLIRDGARPTAACEQCGFGNYVTFYRTYKKALGASPAETAGEADRTSGL